MGGGRLMAVLFHAMPRMAQVKTAEGVCVCANFITILGFVLGLLLYRQVLQVVNS